MKILAQVHLFWTYPPPPHVFAMRTTGSAVRAIRDVFGSLLRREHVHGFSIRGSCDQITRMPISAAQQIGKDRHEQSAEIEPVKV